MTEDVSTRPVAPAAVVTTESPINAHRRVMQYVDLGVVLAAIVTTLILGFGTGAPLLEDRPQEALSISLAVIWPLMLWLKETTATTILGQGAEEYRRVLGASAWTLMLVAAVSYFIGTERGRWFLLGAMAIGTAGLLLSRHVLRLRLHRLMTDGLSLHRVFVIAAPSRAQEIHAQIEGKDSRYQPAGEWLLYGHGDPDPTTIIRRALEVGADTILYAPLGTENTQWTRRLGWAMENSDLSLLVSPSLVEVAGPRLSVEPVEGLAFVRVDMPRFSGPSRVAKRGLDLIGASLGLLLLGLPMLVVGLLIRRDSEGPAIFKQTRAGIGSSTFRCWKFRTMYTGADAERAALRAAQVAESAGLATVGSTSGSAATFKMADDPRITGIGRLLRKYSIDELPQLVNVLKGEMSLVGPRPHPLDDVELYDDVATRRLLAKPGMTGLWQVSGRSDLAWDEAVRLDLNYVENWSLATDVLILLRTVKVVAAGSGAY
ncbi:MAG TPA: sugar transferase [Dermatophilaceae bacterium]|jgi:exopolysaccharide biosynthesis polyprenyl glycosylphosphotransferase|nr:sugar transferase [Dermatophilaceae bacterium]